MSDCKKSFTSRAVTIDYWPLGTISIMELAHAVVEDAHALSDIYNVRFVKAPRLKLVATDAFGREVQVMYPGGGLVRYLSTHHFRPACKDYEL